MSVNRVGRKRMKIFAAIVSILLALSAVSCARKEQQSGVGQESQATGQQAAGAGQESQATGQQGAGAGQESQAAGQLSGAEQASQTKQLLQVQVLKVGKADAIALLCGGSTMVIDCGEEEDGQEVVDYLQGQGVQKIDVLIVTHFDKDHVGGADTVIEEMPVDRVLMPAYTGTGKQYKEFVAVLEETGIKAENLEEVLSFDIGGAAVTVEPPASYEIPDPDEEYDNDFSLITTVVFGGKRLVFTGDIEEARIREWLAGGTVQRCDFLKVPHHGRYNDALEEMIAALEPAYAVICDSEKHPASEETLELLQKYGAECMQTKNGDISIVCDGTKLEVRQ